MEDWWTAEWGGVYLPACSVGHRSRHIQAVLTPAGRQQQGLSRQTYFVSELTPWSKSLRMTEMLLAHPSNLTGLYIHFSNVHPSLMDELESCLSEIGARESPTLALDTTHFVTSSPLVGGDESGRGGAIDPAYQEAVRANLPVVSPDWLLAVARERKLVPISSFTLPPPPSDAAVASNPAPFKRPEPIKKSSLPLSRSGPSSPVLERPEQWGRSPSPETIARMSTGGAAERHSPISTPTKQSSYDSTSSRDGDKSRPRSPKPEADGKLDR